MLMFSACARYAQVYESACASKDSGSKELTSEEVNAELERWKPTHDYGTDSVFSITPPLVSPQDMALYEKACRVAEKGPLFQTTEYRVYSKYVSTWSTQFMIGFYMTLCVSSGETDPILIMLCFLFNWLVCLPPPPPALPIKLCASCENCLLATNVAGCTEIHVSRHQSQNMQRAR